MSDLIIKKKLRDIAEDINGERPSNRSLEGIIEAIEKGAGITYDPFPKTLKGRLRELGLQLNGVRPTQKSLRNIVNNIVENYEGGGGGGDDKITVEQFENSFVFNGNTYTFTRTETGYSYLYYKQDYKWYIFDTENNTLEETTDFISNLSPGFLLNSAGKLYFTEWAMGMGYKTLSKYDFYTNVKTQIAVMDYSYMSNTNAISTGVSIYMVGGYDMSNNDYITKIIKFDTTFESFETLSSELPYAIYWFGICSVKKEVFDDVYIIGGVKTSDYETPSNAIFKLDTETDTLTQVDIEVPEDFVHVTVCFSYKDKIYVICYQNNKIYEFDTTNLTIKEVYNKLNYHPEIQMPLIPFETEGIYYTFDNRDTSITNIIQKYTIKEDNE